MNPFIDLGILQENMYKRKYTLKEDIILEGRKMQRDMTEKEKALASLLPPIIYTRKFTKGTVLEYNDIPLPMMRGLTSSNYKSITFFADGGMMKDGKRYNGRINYSFIIKDGKEMSEDDYRDSITPVDSRVGKYRINKSTSLLKADPSKRGAFGRGQGVRIVRTLNEGEIINVTKIRGGGFGIVMTPYLFLSDGTYVVGYNADKVGGVDSKIQKEIESKEEYKAKEVEDKKPNYLLIVGAVIGASAIGFGIYKIIK